MDKKITMSVQAVATFLREQSSPENKRYLWNYEVTITNDSEEVVQLLNRCWRISDIVGHVEEVRGPGVVGLQPIIKPGKKFVYNSFCQLASSQGSMEGHYEMQTLDEEKFLLAIPKMILTSPLAETMEVKSTLH